MAKFPLGKVVATPAALEHLAPFEELQLLTRHVNGDWGDLDEHDIQVNEDALRYGSRLMSAYTVQDGTKIWIITEWDRSITTILLTDDY